MTMLVAYTLSRNRTGYMRSLQTLGNNYVIFLKKEDELKRKFFYPFHQQPIAHPKRTSQPSIGACTWPDSSVKAFTSSLFEEMDQVLDDSSLGSPAGVHPTLAEF